MDELGRAHRFCLVLVAGNPDAVQPHWIIDFAHEVGRKHDCAIDDGDDRDLLVSMDFLYLLSELFDAAQDLGLGN